MDELELYNAIVKNLKIRIDTDDNNIYIELYYGDTKIDSDWISKLVIK